MKIEKVGIIIFPFGSPSTIPPNRVLGEIGLKKAQELKKALVYTHHDISISKGGEVDVEYFEEKSNKPSTTLQMAREAVKWAKDHHLTELLVIAAKPHLWRVLRDLSLVIKESEIKIELRTLPEIEEYPEDFWFCSESTQKRTRSKIAWKTREKILRLIPKILYKKFVR
ncbi:MAG: hypothetical protein AB7D02_02550 [Candidatus Paceibacterota bacterium]